MKTKVGYLFIYCFFNDAVSILDCIASDGVMLTWPDLMYYRSISLNRLWKNWKNIGPDSKSPGRDLNARIILKRIFINYGVIFELDSPWSGLDTVVRCCEHGNEHSGSVKGGQFLDHLSYC